MSKQYIVAFFFNHFANDYRTWDMRLSLRQSGGPYAICGGQGIRVLVKIKRKIVFEFVDEVGN